MSEFVFSKTQTTTLAAATLGDLLPGSTAGVETQGCDEVVFTINNAGAETIESIYVMGSAYTGSTQFVNLSTAMSLATGATGIIHIVGYRGGPIRLVGTSATGSVGVVAEAGFFRNEVSGPFQSIVDGVVTSDSASGSTTMRSVEFFSPPTKGVEIHAQVAAGAAVAISSAFTVAFPARNIVIARGGAGDPTVYTVTGTRLGAAQTETFTSDDANDIVGVKVWDTITSITSDVDPGVTSDFETGDLIGLQTTALAVDRAGCAASAVANYVVEAATLNTLKDAVTFTTATNGAKYFRVQYSHSHSHT